VFPVFPAEDEKVVILGPEGGFTPTEVELFSAQGAQKVSLGDRILKTEVALSAILGILSTGHMKPNPMI
jgi:RsmE family RNA methyltransferase